MDPLAYPATVLGDSSLDPGEFLKDRKKADDLNESLAIKAAGAAKVAAAKKKPPTAHEFEAPGIKDLEYFGQQKQQYLDNIQSMLSKYQTDPENGGGDPFDPSTPNGIAKLRMEMEIDDALSGSIQQHEYGQNLLAKIDSDKDAYAPGTREKVVEWLNKPFNERRGSEPDITTSYDFNKQMNLILDKMEVDRQAGAYADGPYNREWSSEELSIARLNKAADEWGLNEHAKPAFARQIADMPQDQKISLLAMAKRNGITPEQQAARNKLAPNKHKQDTSTIENASSDAVGSQNADMNASWLHNTLSGMVDGTYEGEGEAAEAFEVGGYISGLKKGEQKYRVWNTFEKFNASETKTTVSGKAEDGTPYKQTTQESIGLVVRDNETGKMARIQDISELSTGKVKWMEPEAARSEIAAKIETHNKGFSISSGEKYLKSQGKETKKGNVDYQGAKTAKMKMANTNGKDPFE